MSLSKSKIFLVFCSAFVSGVFLGRFFNFEIMAFGAMIFIMVLTLGWNRKLYVVGGIAGIIIIAGSWWYGFYSKPSDIPSFYGQTITGSGIIIQEPDERPDKTLLTVSDLRVGENKIRGRLLLTVPRFPEHEYGQKLEFRGKIIEPMGAEEAGEFSYKNYLSRYGIEGLVYHPKISASEPGHGNPVMEGILKIKQLFVGKLSEIMPEPQNSFLAGLLVGLRRGIPQDLMELFAITGVTHIVAISGFNITIIARGIERVLERFGRKISFGISLAAIAVFVIMAGAGASVVRAGIMGAMLLLSANTGRLYAITNALVFTAAVMVGLNPKLLHFDVGFQLSFLALMGLVYLAPNIEQYFARIPKFINQFLVPTVAAQIFVLPVLLYNFDRFSLVATLTNILVLPVIPLGMFTGFLAGVLALIHPVLAMPLAWITWFILTYVIRVVELTSRMPYASFELHNFSLYLAVLYYLLLIGIMLAMKYPQYAARIYEKWKPQPKTQSSI